jgi:hypothetical protein
MVGMKIQEWLDSLRRGRTWEEVGGRKLPYVTIVLKYVFLSSSSSLPTSLLQLSLVWRVDK